MSAGGKLPEVTAAKIFGSRRLRKEPGGNDGVRTKNRMQWEAGRFVRKPSLVGAKDSQGTPQGLPEKRSYDAH